MTCRIAMIGATGLVGRQLWPLLERNHELLVLGRRSSGARQERLGEAGEWPRLLAGERLEVAISTLGTTRRKAGSWDAFVAVDRDAVLGFAEAARGAGAQQFIGISSVGADPASRTPYLSLKGAVEQALANLGFDRIDIARPGLLLGDRPGDPRVLEQLAAFASPVINRLLPRSLDRYRAISSQTVARALARLPGERSSGLHLHHNAELRRLAEG